MTKMIELYSFGDFDRSGKVRWTAHELGVEVEEHRVRPGDHRKEPYLSVNPYAQIPTAIFDGHRFVESTAICISLAERFSKSGLIPAPATPESDEFWQILTTATHSLEMPSVVCLLSQRGILPPTWRELYEKPTRERLTAFVEQLPDIGYVLGPQFTLADICAGYVLRVAVEGKLLNYEGFVKGYLDRLIERPAAQSSRCFEGFPK